VTKLPSSAEITRIDGSHQTVVFIEATTHMSKSGDKHILYMTDPLQVFLNFLHFWQIFTRYLRLHRWNALNGCYAADCKFQRCSLDNA
jgi:hypothetical protein